MDLNELRDAIYQDAVAHGLWEDADRWARAWAFAGEDAERKNLWNTAAQSVRCEAIELVEVSALDIYNNTDNREHFIEELADVIIMSLSVAGKLGIDIDAAVRRKMEINKARPWKHGETL